MKALRKRRSRTADLRPRCELLHMPALVHGGIDPDELNLLGLDSGQVLDFSVNTNPFGPPPAVRDMVAQVPVDNYPDPEARVLRQALAEHLDHSPSQILPGNGVAELIWLVALTFLRPQATVLILGPTYAEYARAAALMGAPVTTLLTRREDDFAFQPDRVLDMLRRLKPALVFLCNPNNPTGAFLEREEIVFWARKFPSTLFVADEAYVGFVPEGCLRLAVGVDFPNAKRKRGLDNLLLLRSMTKDLGLAGLRLGYALGSEEVINWLARARPPWSVNSLAQAAGVEALRHPEYYQNCLRMLASAKAALLAGLSVMGFKPVPSATPFFLMHVGDGSAFRLKLLRKGILVRDGASFGLPEYVRLATRRPAENNRLLAALAELKEAPHAG